MNRKREWREMKKKKVKAKGKAYSLGGIGEARRESENKI